MYRWPLCKGGLYVQVASTYRWPLCTSGLYVKVASTYRWPLCTGGLYVQVAFMYRQHYDRFHSGIFQCEESVELFVNVVKK
jgi:hypothetical protein